ncbi:MAG: alpha-amylase [Candidatus Izimaplasma sp.]|nr:alpha-amylase [Candidatus Izimaplasma bacterium]
MRKTNIKLRNLVFYQIYVRNFSEEGSFKAIINDLDRIKDLGVDVILLMPIHPIGEQDRIGTLGNPYSIKSYNAIRDELGTMQDFEKLIEAIHNKKMKIMMDIVYNHTAKDSYYHKNHPEWYFKNDLGDSCSKVNKWTDVYDFDFSSDKTLWFELLNILVKYARMDIDGFRCDTASMIPLDFWKMARKQISRVNRKFIWLSESIRGKHLKQLRDMGLNCLSESELYQEFDIAQDLDVEPDQKAYLKGEGPLRHYLEALRNQEQIYPKNYVKLHHIETYDSERIAKRLDNDLDKIKNWNAFLFFQKGASLIYAGQEYASNILPSLYEKEVFDKPTDLTDFFKKLTRLKNRSIFANGIYTVHMRDIDEVAYQTFENEKIVYHGIFNLGKVEGQVEININDGRYRNYLDKKIIKVENGKIDLKPYPIIVREKK